MQTVDAPPPPTACQQTQTVAGFGAPPAASPTAPEPAAPLNATGALLSDTLQLPPSEPSGAAEATSWSRPPRRPIAQPPEEEEETPEARAIRLRGPVRLSAPLVQNDVLAHERRGPKKELFFRVKWDAGGGEFVYKWDKADKLKSSLFFRRYCEAHGLKY